MNKALNIFKKYLLRHKEINIAIMILIVVPAVSSYILGYAFSNHVVNNVPTVIVDHDNSTLSENFVKQIDTNEIFNVTNYKDNNEDIKELMENGNVVLGIIIPENFSKDILLGKAPKILILYDGTQMSVVSVAKSRIAEVLGTIKASYLINLAQGKLGIMPEISKSSVIPIQTNVVFLGNPTKSTANFILQGMIIGIVQIGIIILGVLIVKERENYLALLLKTIVIGIIGFISTFIALLVQYKYFAMPYSGSIKGAILLTLIFSITTCNLGCILRFIIKDKLSAVTMSGILISGTVLIAGYTFPLITMPNIYKKIAKIIPFLYYGIPMRDLSLLGLSFNDILPNLFILIKFMIITWIIMLSICILKKLFKINYKILNKSMSKVMNGGKKVNENSKIHS